MDVRGNIGSLYVLSNGQIKDPLNLNSFHPLSTVNTLIVYLEDGGGDGTATMINYKADKLKIPNSHNFPMLYRGLEEHTISGEIAPRTFAKYITYIPSIVSRYNVNSKVAMPIQITLTQDGGFNFVGIFANTTALNAYETPTELDIAYVTDNVDYGYYQYDGTIWEIMGDDEISSQVTTKQYNMGYIQLQGGNAPSVPITTLTDEQYKLIWQYMETLAGQDGIFQEDLNALELIVASNSNTINNIIDGTQGIDYDNSVSGLTATNLQDAIDEIDGNVDDLEQLTTDILDGTKAFTEISLDDGLGNIETITHASKEALDNEVARLETDKADKTYVDSQDLLDEKLANKVTDFSVIDDTKYPTTQAIKTEIDKKVNKTQTIIGIDLQDNILIGEFRTALGNATQSVAGLLSAEDKTHLDVLVALLENSDGNNVVDTIGEILDIFQNYPEGANVLEALNDKVNKNANITAGTHPKITYDTKGLVTGGEALVVGDIPNLNASKINAGTFDEARIPNLAPTKITQNATNRFVTDVEKAYWNGKQDKLVAGNNITIDPDTNVISSSGGNGGVTELEWDNILNKPTFATVAESGEYDDLIDKPDIPTKVSDLTNDTGYITEYTETDPIFTAWDKSTGISITKSQVSDLIEATQALSGLMSATDKQRLDVLHALLEEDTSNNVVDSINEVLSIFNNYPEGADLVTALAGKVDKVEDKGLSENDLTNTLKSNYDTAYSWGDHAVEGYLKEITKVMVEGVLTGTITSHNHSGVYEPANANIQSHISSTNNPHGVTKADVGLGNLQNYAIASKTQAEAGTSNVLYMTPLRTKELITVVMGDIESALDAILGV